MNGLRQTWLVARREVRERGRSKAFRFSILLMLLIVIAAIVVPTLISSNHTKHVGTVGATPAGLDAALVAEGELAGLTITVQHFATVAEGEAAVRDEHLDVLLVDGTRMAWRRTADSQLRTIVAAAVQVTTLSQRAAAEGISPEVLARVLAPIELNDVTLGSAAGRSADDETAAMIMTIALFITLSTYGGLVLTGVVEEKASRVVEVLLARMPARSLLAGKVIGIGLLGLAQVVVTAAGALIAESLVHTVHVPAVRAGVLVWAVLWFVLGYAFYAMVYGTLGSLATRTEDAQTAAGPLVGVLLVAYFASFAAVGAPDGTLAHVASFVPLSAPMAMPIRIALGAAEWWEPVASALVMSVAIAGLVQLGGRVYTRAILHTGSSLKLREAWRTSRGPARSTS